MSDQVVGLVCARGGSKGIPRKNLRTINGKPLVRWAIESGLSCPSIGRVIVSTDDEGIAAAAHAAGGEVPFMRPASLAEDNTSEWLVWRHAIQQIRILHGPFKQLVILPPTAPLRSLEDIERCIQEHRDSEADVVITVTPAHRNPYFNMVRIENGYATIAVKPETPFVRRQDAPTLYDMTTVAYVANPDFVLRAGGLFQGRVRAVVIPAERAIDIDTQLDLDVAQFLVNRQLPTERSSHEIHPRFDQPGK